MIQSRQLNNRSTSSVTTLTTKTTGVDLKQNPRRWPLPTLLHFILTYYYPQNALQRQLQQSADNESIRESALDVIDLEDDIADMPETRDDADNIDDFEYIDASTADANDI